MQSSFAAIASTAVAPLILIVNADSPYRSLTQFIEYAKSNSKEATFGSPGAGSAPHLTASCT